MSDQPVVFAEKLTKKFGDATAVDSITFGIERGEVFGILGPNGAGKSTTMRMISGVSPATSGTLRILGMAPETHGPDIRTRMGIIPQDNLLDQHLNVRENLTTYARYFGMSRARARQRAAELLDFVQLRERADDEVQPLSGGMKRRLAIARALVNEPELVILDEPTTGLDPQARHLLWERLFQLKQQGTTLILATHYMDEAEQLCDRLIIMDHGRIVGSGSPRDLVASQVAPEVVELRFDGPSLDDYAGKLIEIGNRVEQLPDRILVFVEDGDTVVAEIHRRRLYPSSVLVRRSTLEDVFLLKTGRRLVD
ncbi:ABC transporter ATP-binding protein [Streptomyces europaeiscabiei]|uniref:ABC transporter ATP-binding protein n=1 Tax=Streptomyces europaeiscabiei TaxID=146819 RepID=UPI0029A553FB|nr:ABC transporter ATP-binding protein [Streptomyces europaeiscabiei]MDX2525295.1 ABC transporter ATP-binding protein [Streptomyces europaeiscabiei]